MESMTEKRHDWQNLLLSGIRKRTEELKLRVADLETFMCDFEMLHLLKFKPGGWQTEAEEIRNQRRR